MSNESQVIIGETGASYQINSLSDLKFICENYFKELGVTQNDISIINNLDQNFVYLHNLQYKTSSKYFLFSKRYNNKLLQSFYNYQNKNTADLSSSPNDISINIPDISKYLYILESNNENLSCSIEEIKQIYETMLDFYNNYNTIYKNFNLNIRLMEKIKEYYKYQNEGVDLMNNIALLKYEKCFDKYQQFLKESENTKTNNDLILQNYMENIDKLKKTELPSSFIKYITKKKKNNDIKYLIDIYYKESDMNIWRDNCLDKQNVLFNKIKIKDKILQKEKIQINKDNNALLLPLKNTWNFYLNEYDKLYQERSGQLLSFLNEINNDFNSFNNLLSQMKEIFESKLLNSNPNYSNTIKESCQKIIAFKEKYSDMNKLTSLQNFIQPFNDYVIKMNNSIESISKKINDYFMAVRTVKNILEKLTDKFSVYLQALKNIEEDFQFLKTPGHFINSYENTLLELKRRKSFNSDMQEELNIIKALINNENYLRKKFMEDNKKYLTPDFIKLFKLENKIFFNLDFQNNNEHFDLSIIFPEVNHKNNENNNINESNNENEAPPYWDEKQEINNNKKVIKNLMNQITELDIKLKNRENELSEMQTKYKNIDNNFQELNKDMKYIYTIFDEISDSFNQELSFKEQQISDLEQKLEIKTKQSKENNDVNNMETNYNIEVNKYKKRINELDSNYKKIISETIILKKSFFNHMNMVIAQKNQEMSKFKEKQEEKVMYLEEILSAEKIFNKNSINHKISNLNNTIIEYKMNLNSSKEKLSTLEKTNSELKSKELFLERELKISIQKNEKLTDNNIELTNELRQKHKDNAYLSKLLEQIKKDKVESIKLLNSTHQSKLDYLNEKLNQLSESIREKENEDSKKYQQYIEMKDKYIYLTKEKEIYIQQIKELSCDLQEKNKKIDELILTQSLVSKATKSNTNDLTLSSDNEDIIYYKKIEIGMRCIFVPFYENIFVCINLSENMLEEKEHEGCPLSNYECKYILDLNSFNKDLSKIIIDNSLIVIGKISKLTKIEQSQNKLYNLPESKIFILATLGKVDYVIGFPENELMFNNYIN
jgi:hypothetical protein